MQNYFILCLISLGILNSYSLANAQENTSIENEANFIPNLESNLTSIVLSNSPNIIIKKASLIAQENENIVPSDSEVTIKDIQVIFIDREGNITQGKTKPEIILREFDLQPGDIYNSESAQLALEGVNDLVAVNQATLTLESGLNQDEVIMVVTVEENNPFFFKFGGTLQPPTALQGSARPVTVAPMSNKALGLAASVRFGVAKNSQVLALGVEGGENSLGFDLEYRQFMKHDRGYAINLFNRRGVEPEFDRGARDVDLANGDDPWVHRIGGGVEFFQPLGKDFQGALGVSYQVVSIRDDVFSSRLNSRDELGNRLTVSDDGQDRLLTLNFATALDRRNRTQNPTDGYRLLVQTDQSIPIGDANLFYNRLTANYTQYIPFSLFGFSEGDRTLVLNFQGGTIIGDVPGYEAFSLGGSQSVRGYGGGELGTGRSFIQGTAEYRFPIFSVNAFKEELNVGGTLFIDYATDLGSGDSVIGEPGEARDKPGDGFGYGLGLRTQTPVGVVKLELAINDRGDSEFIFNIGDRF